MKTHYMTAHDAGVLQRRKDKFGWDTLAGVPEIFFDSLGAAHETCAGSHPDAAALGPTAYSRRLTDAEFSRVFRLAVEVAS